MITVRLFDRAGDFWGSVRLDDVFWHQDAVYKVVDSLPWSVRWIDPAEIRFTVRTFQCVHLYEYAFRNRHPLDPEGTVPLPCADFQELGAAVPIKADSAWAGQFNPYGG